MALIGQIAISMVTDTGNFNKGLLGAAASLKTFEKVAFGNLLKGSKYVTMGLNNINKGIINLGTGMTGKAGQGFNELLKGINQFYGGIATVGVGLAKLGLGTVAQGFQFLGSAISSTIHFVADLAKKALFLGVVLGGLAAYALWNVAKGAIALGEQTDRSRIIFGKFSNEVISESKLMGTAFGVARREFIQAASAFGTIFQGAGYIEEDTKKLSIHFVKMATDMSSLAHIPVEEAMDKIKSGLAGNIRPLRDMGISISEATVETYAYKHGIATLGKELTDQEKIQARIGLITEKAAIAQGNLALTADSAGNQVRSLSGRFENLKDSLGTALLGMLVPALEEVNTGIHAIQIAWDNSAIGAASATAGILGSGKKQTTEIGYIQSAVMWLVDTWQLLKVTMLKTAASSTLSIQKMVDSMSAFMKVFLGRAPKHMTDTLDNLSKSLDELNTAALKGAMAEGARPRPSLAVADAFARARKDVEEKRAELAAKPPLDVNKLKPVTEAAQATETKFASAAAMGSKEAANIALRSKYGGDVAKSKAPEKTAENTGKMVTLLEQMGKRMVRDYITTVSAPLIEID